MKNQIAMYALKYDEASNFIVGEDGRAFIYYSEYQAKREATRQGLSYVPIAVDASPKINKSVPSAPPTPKPAPANVSIIKTGW